MTDDRTSVRMLGLQGPFNSSLILFLKCAPRLFLTLRTSAARARASAAVSPRRVPVARVSAICSAADTLASAAAIRTPAASGAAEDGRHMISLISRFTTKNKERSQRSFHAEQRSTTSELFPTTDPHPRRRKTHTHTHDSSHVHSHTMIHALHSQTHTQSLISQVLLSK